MPSSQPIHYDDLIDYHHLTPRDEQLLTWLAEHYVLTADQITTALFPSPDSARRRLLALSKIDAVDRIWSTQPTGHLTMYCTLGTLGMRLHPSAYNRRDDLRIRPPREIDERPYWVTTSPRMTRLHAVNTFFTDLAGHARHNPGTRLNNWWPSHKIADITRIHSYADGHATWTVGDTTTRFFFHHVRGNEPVLHTVAKIQDYRQITRTGRHDIVLVHLPTRKREAIIQEFLDFLRLDILIATTTHDQPPTEPVWTRADRPNKRLHLHELADTTTRPPGWAKRLR